MKIQPSVFFFAFVYLMPFLSKAQAGMRDSASYQKIMQIAEQIRKQYAPDRRTALFDIHLDTSTGIPKYRIETTEVAAKNAFMALVEEADIPAEVSITLFPDSSVAGRAKGIVNLSVANFRTSPRNQAEMATQALLGTTIDLLQEQDGYFRARTPEGYIAWVKTSSVAPKTDSALVAWQTHDKVIFVADFGHSYQEADASSLRVSDLVMGDILLTTGISGDYTQVVYPDGRKAFVKRDQVQSFEGWQQALNLTAENILNVAKTMIGLPYLWGGTSVKGVDCSGFTKTAYYMNGLIIPRDASQQVLAGLELDVLTEGNLDTAKVLEHLQPADLLFFAAGKGETPNPRITHVALYMGGGQFIHSSGTVRINSLLSGAPNYDAHQAHTLVAARRYLGQQDPQLQSITTHPAYNQANVISTNTNFSKQTIP